MWCLPNGNCISHSKSRLTQNPSALRRIQKKKTPQGTGVFLIAHRSCRTVYPINFFIDYNKNNTTLNSFNVTNNSNFTANNGTDFNLFRNATVDATSSDYVTLYKLTKGGGLAKDLSSYNQLSFTASGNGAGSLRLEKHL